MHNVCGNEEAGVCVCVCVCGCVAAFELQAEAINKDCSEMRHESSSAPMTELYIETRIFFFPLG